MAEIGQTVKCHNRLRSWATVVVFLYSVCYLDASPPQQQAKPDDSRKMIEVLNYDTGKRDAAIDPNLFRIIGNVRVKHNDALMWCDSAYVYENRNYVTAYSRVRIEQGDTLSLFGNYLLYDGQTEKAFITGNVRLIDKETVLYTDELNYNLAERVAYYDTGGRIINGDDTLRSKSGTYFSYDKMFHFSDNIRINSPDYVITADTMHYHTESEIVYFMGPTNITGDSIKMFAHGGWYDTKNKISRIWDNAIVDNFKQLIEGDSLFYNEATGYGVASGNVSITDTANNSVVRGHKAVYHKEPENFFVTDSALYIMTGDSDSLYMHADTLRSTTFFDQADSTLSYRIVRAYYGTRVFSRDFQSQSDSLSYSFRDSTIRMYGKPVIWSEENQLSSDSLTLFTKNSKMDRMELYNNALVISQVDSIRFNQIKGRSLIGYFADNELYKVLVEGNGESIYFLIEVDELVGVNYSKSSNIEILVEDGKLLEVTEFGNPDGYLDPPLLKKPDDLRLQGFQWLFEIRPADKTDVFRRR
jgi:lipopolysaccharide export system protein LptA